MYNKCAHMCTIPFISGDTIIVCARTLHVWALRSITNRDLCSLPYQIFGGLFLINLTYLGIILFTSLQQQYQVQQEMFIF